MDQKFGIKWMKQNLSRSGTILYPLAWVAMASAAVVESDTYRYATIAFVLLALISFRNDMRLVSRHWLSLLCYAWAAYVLIRFLYGVIFWDEKGTSEWLYLFPAFFPAVGVALYNSRQHLYAAATVGIALSFIALVATLSFEALNSGSRAAPLFHNNPIHAGVGCGFIFLCSVFWLAYSLESGRLQGQMKWPIIVLSTSTAIASIFGVLGAQSKGVWVALAATTAVLVFMSILLFTRKWRIILVGGLCAAIAAFYYLSYQYIVSVSGATFSALADLYDNALSHGSLSQAIKMSIENSSTPIGTAERLQLLSNSIQIFEHSPWFGWGNFWLSAWKATDYSNVQYTILHNGYLEILVRHGLLGLLTLVVVISVSLRIATQAVTCGYIYKSTYYILFLGNLYFFLTIFTNSNNRLAIGESFLIISGASTFAILLISNLKKTDAVNMFNQNQ